MLEGLERWVRDREREVKVLIGGDFNAKTANEGGGVESEEDERDGEKIRGRKSKDTKINREGRMLVEFIEEWGLGIFNGRVKGDEEGEYTFTGGKGNTVIDYVMGDGLVEEKIERIRIGDKVNSDHHPIEVWIRGEVGEKGGKRGKGRGRRGVWDEEGRKTFKRKMEETMVEERGLKEGVEGDGKKGKRGNGGSGKEWGGGNKGTRGWWGKM